MTRRSRRSHLPSTPGRLLAVVITLLAAGCGSSDGGGTGGTGVTSRNVGAISSTNNGVMVNGVTYDASAATVTIDKQGADASALRIGMVVSVEGQVDASGAQGSASRIDYDHELEGPVEALLPADNGFTVLGQTVIVDAATFFEGTTFATLRLNDVVEVSGFTDGSGVVHATYVKNESGAGSQEADLEGWVSQHNGDAQTFAINGLVVRYNNATRLVGAMGVSDGQYVEVTGTYAAGVFIATKVEVEDHATDFEAGERIRIEGYVTAFVSAADFRVDGRPVTTTPETLYEHGTAANLALNVRLTVEGTMNAAGVLAAHRIEFD